MSRKLGRDREQGAESEPDEVTGPDEGGWPARRLKRWPVAVDFESSDVGLKRIKMMGYQKVVGSVQVLFTDDNMTPVLGRLQDYCFQQGAITNANPRDRAFFMSCLGHDLVFFEGDQERAIVDDMPLDTKVYDALPHMRQSHYDLYRVKSRSFMGRLKLESMLQPDVVVEVAAGPFGGPKAGEWILARRLSFGRSSAQLVEPWLRVSEAEVDAVRRAFGEEYRACRALHPGLTRASMLKVGGYHLYEEVVSRKLISDLEAGLPSGVTLRPRMVTMRVSKRRDLPRLEDIDRARVVESDEAGRPNLVLVDLAPSSGLHRSIRDAMVTVEGQELILVAFIAQGTAALLEELTGLLPSDATREDVELEPLAVYRSLRHTVKAAR